jgi:release factor glutamine methyltransferase
MVHFAGMPGKIMFPTLDEILREAAKALRPKKIRCAADADEGRLDAEILLAHALKRDRAWIAAHGNDRLSGMLQRKFAKLIERRMAHEPVAYITGVKDFYGRPFRVTPATLIPRPETELIIDILVSKFKRGDTFTLVDIGTGCGAIAITAALEFPNARVIATDISRRALAIAGENAKLLHARVTLVKGDLLSSSVLRTIEREGSGIKDQGSRSRTSRTLILDPCPLILAANLPYLPDRDKTKLDPDVIAYEPHEALFAGKDGLNAIRKLFDQIERDLPVNPDLILAEFDPPQAKTIIQLAKESFPLMKAEIRNDLAGRNRVLVCRL